MTSLKGQHEPFPGQLRAGHCWVEDFAAPVPYLEQRDVVQNVPVPCSEGFVFLIRSIWLHNGIIITNIPGSEHNGAG